MLDCDLLNFFWVTSSLHSMFDWLPFVMGSFVECDLLKFDVRLFFIYLRLRLISGAQLVIGEWL